MTSQQVTNEDGEFLRLNNKIAQVTTLVRVTRLSHANLSVPHNFKYLLPQKQSQNIICFIVVVM